MPAMDRRFQPRAIIELAAQYRRSDRGIWRPALIKDLSGGGSAVLIDDGLALGTALAGFRFLLPDEVGEHEWPLVVAAQIVRCVEAPDAPLPFLARLQFLHPPPREVETIRRFVHRALHGDAADQFPLVIPPYEIAARSTAADRMARRLDTARREGAALERDLTALGSEAARASGALDRKIAALHDVLYAAVATEERLRAEIRRLAEGQRREGAGASDEPSSPRPAADGELTDAERVRLTGERDAARREAVELRDRLATSAGDLQAARAEGRRLEERVAELRDEAARQRELAARAGERPLPLPTPAARDSRWGPELLSLAAGLVLGVLAVLAWQRFVTLPATVAQAAPPADAVAAPSSGPAPTAEPAPATPRAAEDSASTAAATSEPAPSAADAPPRPAARLANDSPAPPPLAPAIGRDVGPRQPAADEGARPAAVASADDAPGAPATDRETAAAAGASPTPTADKRLIRGTAEAWAAAWSDRRVEDFLGLYSDSFAPTDVSRGEWETARRDEVSQPPWERFRVNRMRYRMLSDNQALVDINLVCASGSQSSEANNTLELEWTADGWRILREHGAVGCPLTPMPSPEVE